MQTDAPTTTEATTEIICVTADVIERHKTISFTYLGHVPRISRDDAGLIGIPWGHLWDDGKAYVFNVIERGNLVVGGGFEYDLPTEHTKMMLDEVPHCSMLMSSADFEWLEEKVLKPAGRQYRRIHIDHTVSTHEGA